MGGNLLGEGQREHHLRGTGLFQGISVGIRHVFRDDGEGAQIGTDDLQPVAGAELVVQAANRLSVLTTGFHLRHNLPLADVTGIRGVLPGLAKIEAGGVNPVGNVLHLVPPYGVNRPPGGNVVDAVPVSPRDDGGVVGGFRPSLDFDAVHPGVHQLFQVVDHAHIPGI